MDYGSCMSPVSLDKLLRSTGDGVVFAVKVSPKSHQDAIKDIVELPHDRIGLAVRVSPAAADGAANEAVIELLSGVFKVPRSCVEIKSGAASRTKMIGITGDPAAPRASLDASGCI